jgi:rhamnopyranosyl-N-acetylglucosaminyl-diphospho-decaprenol beta-1,3/1,4-galactofuranosyltransferase
VSSLIGDTGGVDGLGRGSATTTTRRSTASVVAVILSYNRRAMLERAIAGVLSGTVVPDRVIVVDNGSRDGSAELVATLPGVEAILLPENVGIGAGHNVGWKRALDDPRCQWIWSIEHDVDVLPNTLEMLLEGVATHPDPASVGAVTPRLREDRTADPAAKPTPGVIDLREPWETITKFSFNATLFARSAIELVGFVREDFFACQEDRELWLRLRDAGLDAIRIREAVAYHAFRRSRRSDDLGRTYYSTRNWVYLERHHRKTRWWRTRIVGLAVGWCAQSLVLEDRKLTRIRARLLAISDGWRERLGKADHSFLS